MHSPTDSALINTVNAHLRQLDGIAAYNAEEAALRVASTSMRYLLVEDMLARAWRATGFGGPMTFRTWCIASIKSSDAVVYCGGGEVLPNVPFSLCWNATLVERTLDLAAFRQRARIHVAGIKVSTTELVQYVANTLGGAHFDPEGRSLKSRKPAFDLLRNLEAKGFNGMNITINDRNLLHHELLSIIEVTLRSPEVFRLRGWRTPKS